MSKHLSDKIGPDEYDLDNYGEGDSTIGLPSKDCEICGERLASDIWRAGEWFGRLCADCERDGRRGVARSRPRGWNLKRDGAVVGRFA
jgi:hypothetical protein